MSGPHLSVKVRDIAEAEACVRGMQREARGLAARYASMSALHFALAAARAGFEAQVDLRFAQHQVVVNGIASSPDAAVREVVRSAVRELERLAARDPSLVPPQAKAA